MAKDSIKTKEQLLIENSQLKEKITKMETASIKQAALGLKDSEEKLSMALKDSMITVFAQDTNLTYTWIHNPNDEFASQNVIGKKDADLISKEDADRLTKMKSEVLKTGKTHKSRIGFTINNIPYYFNLALEAIKNSNGEITGILGTSIDITDIKKSAEELKEGKDALELTEHIAKLGGWSYDLKTNTPYISNELIELYELDPPRLPSVEEGVKFYAPQDRPIIAQAFQECMEKGTPYDLELRFITEKGNKRWVRAVGKAEKVNGEIVKLSGFLQNITEIKEAEETIQKGEITINETQKKTKLGSWDWNIETGDITWSQEMFLIMEMNPKKDQPTYEAALEKVHPEDRVFYEKSIKEALDNHSIYNIENRILLNNGSVKHMHSLGEVILNKKGIPIRMFGTVQDITEKTETQEALQKSNLKYKELFDSMSEMFQVIELIYDKNGKVIDYYYRQVNPAFEKLVGKTNEEIIDKRAKDIFGIIEDHWLKIYGNVDKTGVSENHENYGAELDKYYHVNAWKISESIIGITFLDVTEEKKAGEALKESEDKFKKIFELSPAIMALTDIETGVYMDVNETWLRKFGYTRDEIIGTKSSDLDLFLNSSDREGLIRMMKEQGFILDHEFQLQTKSGSIFHSIFSTHFVVLKGKRYMLTTAVDITDRKQVELELTIAKVKAEESEEKYKLLFERDTDAIFMYNPETQRIIEANNATSNLYGYSPEELLGKSVVELSAEKVQSSIQLKKIETDGQVHVDLRRHKKKDGSIIYVDIKGFRINLQDKEVMFAVSKNITDRVLAEEALRKSEERFRALFEQTGGYCMILDPNTSDGIPIIIDANEAACTMHGYTRKEFIGRPVSDIDNKAGRKLVLKNTAKIMSGKPFYAENVHIRKDGTYFNVAVNAKRIDIEGEPPLVFSVEYDITERVRAEKALKESEENLKNTFDLSPSIIAKANLDTGYFIEANKAVTRILGYSVEEFISIPFIELIHPDDQQESTDEKDEQLEGKEVTFFENRYLCKDGSYKWMAWHGTKADENGIVRAIGSDISIRKKAELEASNAKEVALENEEKYRLLHENAGLGIGYYTAKGIIISYNSIASRDMNGIPEDFIGKSIFELFPKEHADFYFKRLQKAVNSNEIEVYEDCVKLPTQTKWFLSTYTKIVNSDKKILGIQIISQNITSIKQSEVELKKAKEKAEESDRLKSAFLANMSHEIRTPMNGILGFVNLLNDSDLTRSEIGEYAIIINRSGDRLLNTINDIIDISKIESGEIVVKNTLTSINTEINEIYSFFLPEVNQKGLSLILEPSHITKQLKVNTDSQKLNGILTNLIKNAIKYTRKGSITFGYFIKKDTNPAELEFYVKDTGIGIPKDRINVIFNRFEQAERGDTRAFEGAGLGLAISKAYVEMLGGEIYVESEEGKGSTFSFTIPNNR